MLISQSSKAQTPDSVTVVKEANVTAYRPVARIKNNALVTTIADTPLAQAGSAEDVLARVPGITKKTDKEGAHFEVTGRGAPLFYINGRQVRDLNELRQLRSNEIKSVEVLQSPGARYDATVNAVVRIRTLRRQGEGLGVNASFDYYQGTYATAEPQVKLTYTRGGTEVFAGAEVNRNKHFYDSLGDMYTTTPDTLWFLPLGQHTRSESTTIKTHAGFNQDWGEGNSVGLRYEVTFTPRKIGSGMFDSRILANGSYYDELQSSLRMDVDDEPTHNLNAYYTGRWGKGEFRVDADYYATTGSQVTHNWEYSHEYDDRDFVTNNRVLNRLAAAKVQYEWPCLGGKLALGAQYTYTNRHDDYLIPTNSFGISASRSHQQERNMAGFAEWNALLASRYMLQLGLRYEHAAYNYEQNGVKQQELSPTYDNVFPSFSLATAAGKGANVVQLMLSYSAKMNRPTYAQLSNNLVYASRFLMQTGLPSLRPTFTHQTTAVAVWRFLQATVDYSYYKNSIIMWGTSLPDRQNVTVLAPQNRSYGQFVFALTAAPRWGFYQPRWTVTVVNSRLKVNDVQGGAKKFYDPLFIANLDNVFELPGGFSIDLWYRMCTPGHTQNIKIDDWRHFLEASVSKSFLNKALTVSIGGTDLLYHNSPNVWAYFAQSRFNQGGQGDTRQFYLKLAYRFNVGRSKYKGTQAAEEAIKRL